MNEVAKGFLTRCFAPGETIALLLRGENAGALTQRVVTLEKVLAPRYLDWLAHENRAGANIYVAANPLRPSSRKRTKDCIAFVRHLYIDIDTDGDARLSALRTSNVVPTPNVILSTSSGKYQVLWAVDGFNFACQEQMLKLLAIAFGGDPACTDCNRVLRIPGFLNRNTIPLIASRSNIPAKSSGLRMTSGWTLAWSIPGCSLRLRPRGSSPESTATQKAIGPGFPMSLPTAKTL